MNTTANTTDHGYITAYAGGGSVRHIVKRYGTGFNEYKSTAVCGTKPVARWGAGIRWTSTETPDIVYPTPAAALEARHNVCKRCAAAVARMTAIHDAPDAETLEETTMNTPAANPVLEAHKAAAAANLHPRAAELVAVSDYSAGHRVDYLDASTAPSAEYGTARATVTAYYYGGPGRGDCVDAVILTVKGGDSHPARNYAALDALEALQGRVSGNITAGGYQTIASGDRDTIFVYGTWTD